MASLNLLQWREQSLWQRHRTLHKTGIALFITVTFFSSQWVISYSDYLTQLQQQISVQNQKLAQRKVHQQRWRAYKQQQEAQRTFTQRKRVHKQKLNAFSALLDNTPKGFHQRQLSFSHEQFRLEASYRQIQEVDDHYLWLNQQLTRAELKQQLLPQKRVSFHYLSSQHEGSRG
ncbi:MAG: hypothetical protein ACQEVQ_11920 [Pseudomonadota bacterium]